MRSRSRALLALTAAVAIALSGCSAQQPETSPTQNEERTLTLASWIEPISFDPAQSQDGYYVPFQQAVYDTLIKQLPDGEFAPMLAETWEYNADATELTLTLRDDVVFSDGSALDADVVKANLERFKAQNGPQAATLAALASVRVDDSSTLVLTLTEPAPSLIYHLSNVAGYIASADALEDPALATEPVGSGPYLLSTSETVRGSQYTFERNDDYWGEQLPFSDLVIKILPDATARLNALKSGQVNSAVLGDARGADEAKASGLVFVEGFNNWSGLPLFDRAGEVTPALADERVRQALNMSLDRAGIVDKLLLGYGTVTSQIWRPGAGGYVEELDEYYSFDPKEARDLLAAAGYADGFDLRLPTIAIYDPALKATIAQQLGEIGVRVEWVEFATGDFLAQVRSGDFSSTFMNMASSTDWQNVAAYLLPQSSFNPFHSTDPKVTDFIDQMRVASEADRPAIAAELNEYLVESAWFLPLYRPLNLLFVDKTVDVVPQLQSVVPSIYNYSPAE